MRKITEKNANSLQNFDFNYPQNIRKTLEQQNQVYGRPKVETQIKEQLRYSEHSSEKTVQSDKIKSSKNSLIRGFEGLRVLALLLVLFYHWFPDVVQGGYLGVVAFFTLSGYLTTYSFLKEHHEKGKIQVFSFYKRRLKRLYPSLIFLLFALSTWVVFYQPNVLSNFRAGFFASLFSYNNLWQISAKLSYFEQYAQINLFTHLWALAVEAHYYLLWPWIMVLFLNKKDSSKGKKSLLMFTLVLTGFSILWTFFILGGSQVELNRVYLGTDTRMFSFLLGALVAQIFPLGRIRLLSERVSRSFQTQMTGVLLILILVFSIFLKGGGGFWSYFFMVFWNILFLALMVLVARPTTLIARFFALGPFVSIAKRSFAMYLWHYPIMMLSNYSLQIFEISNTAKYLLILFFSILMAEVSYQLCERFFPSLWMKGSTHVQQSMAQYRAGQLFNPKEKLPFKVLALRTLSIFVIVLLSSSTVYALIKDNGSLPADIVELQEQLQKNKDLPDQIQSSQLKEIETTTNAQGAVDQSNAGGTPALTDQGESPKASENQTSKVDDNPLSEENLKKLEQYLPVSFSRSQEVQDFETVVNKTPQLTLTDLEKRLAPNLPVVLVGDSVLLGAKPEVHDLLPQSVVNADVSRQFAAGAQVIHQMAAENQLPKIIVMALGTNGVISAEQVNTFAETYKDYKIFLVNTVVNNTSEGIANTAIADALARQPNTYLVDWHKLAKTKASWFGSDFVHPSVEGRKIYAQLIVKRVLETLIAEAKEEAGLN